MNGNYGTRNKVKHLDKPWVSFSQSLPNNSRIASDLEGLELGLTFILLQKKKQVLFIPYPSRLTDMRNTDSVQVCIKQSKKELINSFLGVGERETIHQRANFQLWDE